MSVQNLKYGVYGGLAGGIVFGAMMGMMGMVLPPFGDYLMSQRKQPFLVIPATSVSKSLFSTTY